jgi:xylulokinase
VTTDVAPGAGWVLAVDLGTNGLKVGAIGEDGAVLATEHAENDTHFGDDGAVEQDPRQWWDLIAAAARALVGRAGIDAANAVGVAITGQYGSTVAVDARGEPVLPCLVWADHRGRRWSRAAFGGPASGFKPQAVPPFLRYTAGMPSPNGADPSGHALYLRYGRSDDYRRIATMLEPVDYLGFRLTGVVAATPASMLASWLTDNRPGAEPRYVPKLVSATRRDPSRLPPLRPTASILGGLTAAAAADTGLPEGTPVVCGVPDLHAAYVGAGTLAEGRGHFAVSTTSWVSAAVPGKKTDLFHQIASIPGVGPAKYLMVNNHETAGAALQWLRDGIARPETTASYEELLALAATAAPGSDGVLFTPWLKGERSPVDDAHLRAAFLNVSLTTRRADLIRAVLEGVAHNLRWLAEAADGFAGRRLEPLRILGGGARADLWCQIHADVLGRTIERVADPAAAQVRGVALLALVQLGRATWADVESRVPVDRVFTPDPSLRDGYEHQYASFAKVYSRLRPWYRRLNG